MKHRVMLVFTVRSNLDWLELVTACPSVGRFPFGGSSMAEYQANDIVLG